ncbi:MAG TPA: hypothetical protein VMS31_21540 [Pyrinomonadaceae bacterium]|nr:hypothetical protein [Pyrinomonadaceae bacterium]
MYVIYGMPNMAGTYAFTAPYVQDQTQASDWAFTLSLESVSHSEEAAAVDAAARLQRMGIQWLRPSSRVTGPWKVNRSDLAQYFDFLDRPWLRGEQLIRPLFDRTRVHDREVLLVKFVFAPDGALAWEYAAGDPALGWPAVDRLLARIETLLVSSIATDDLQQVGLLARDLTIVLAQTVSHVVAEKLAGVSTSDSKAMLAAYFEHKLRDDRKQFTALARSVYDLAVHLQHKRTATVSDAALCGRAAIALAEIVRVIADRDEQEPEPVVSGGPTSR